MSLCVCGSGQEQDSCCLPFIDGRDFPPTAEALMRARYAAHCLGRFDYLRSSTHPKLRAETDWDDLERWSGSAAWEGLEILGTEQGGKDDAQGVVTFRARFTYQNVPQDHRERSVFERDENGHWVYVDGELDRPEPVRRESPKIGRNDPCSCGSGRKYKKCCGAA